MHNKCIPSPNTAVAVSFSGNISFLSYPVTERAYDFFESGSVTLRTRDEDGTILHAGRLGLRPFFTLEITGGYLQLAVSNITNGG